MRITYYINRGEPGVATRRTLLVRSLLCTLL